MASPTATGADYTPTEAARLCGCSVDTVRRYRDGGRFPTAYRESDLANAAWRIPLGDLIAAGLYTPAEVATDDRPISGERLDGTSDHPAPDLDERLAEAARTIEYLVESNRRLLGLLEALTAQPASVRPIGSAA